jgi:hypothetical protein
VHCDCEVMCCGVCVCEVVRGADGHERHKQTQICCAGLFLFIPLKKTRTEIILFDI